MTLKELTHLWSNPNTTVNLTALGYDSKRKKYYFSRFLGRNRRMDSFNEKIEPYAMSLEVKSIYTRADTLYIDVIEQIEKEDL